MNRKIRVLVVDDEPFVRDSLRDVLLAEGLQVETADSVHAARKCLEARPFDAIVSDVRMPGDGGLQLLDDTRARIPQTPIILVTGVGTVAEAVAAMKKGAFDFVQKPVDPDELVMLVRRAAEHRALLSEVQSLRDARDGAAIPHLVGASAALTHVRTLIAQVASTEAAVLFTGESGSGKDVAARVLHAASARAAGPFVRVVCGVLGDEAFDAEMCGARRAPRAPASSARPTGSGPRRGRFEEAEAGTLVLAEIETLPASGQGQLLQALESGAYRRAGDTEARLLDVRIVALATEDLGARVKSGSFRKDLYYRLAQFPIALPPLRAHKEDIAELAAHWAARRGARNSAFDARLSAEALEVLASYDWPGNVRELENVLERAAIVSGSSAMSPELLRTILESGAPAAAGPDPWAFNLRANLDAREKELLLGALERAKGKKRLASDLLGIDARNLGYYLRKHKLQDASGTASDSDAT